jgi:hypothetical protein
VAYTYVLCGVADLHPLSSVNRVALVQPNPGKCCEAAGEAPERPTCRRADLVLVFSNDPPDPRGTMQVVIALVGAILGGLLGGVITYATTRSRLRLELMHAHDQVLQEQRLARYQQLFHISRRIPRQWRSAKEPTREELNEICTELHDWYFSEEAGGMFLTPTAQTRYMELQNALQETADASSSSPDSPLSPAESQRLRDLARELRHQLAQDVGAADPPRLKWGKPGPLLPPQPR